MSAPIRTKVEPGIYARVADDGRRLGFEVRWKDSEGVSRRRSVQGDVHAARDALAEARVRRVRHESEPLDPRATFGAVADEYERVHVASLRPNSQMVRRAALKGLRQRFASKRITQIGRADVRLWVTDLATDHKANTVRAYYSTMRAVYGFARTDLDIPVTFPRLKPGELPDPADDEREHRVLSDDELSRILGACDPRMRLFFQTAAETGARGSELLGLIPRRVGRDDRDRSATRQGRAAAPAEVTARPACNRDPASAGGRAAVGWRGAGIRAPDTPHGRAPVGQCDRACRA